MTPPQYAIQWLKSQGVQATEDTVLPAHLATGLNVVLCFEYGGFIVWNRGMTLGEHVGQIPKPKEKAK